ncbi:MAG: sigma-54 dependent transcriptional regulator, partial [Kiritimatiellae bacterium]|nr:sigma-54 dependent transcriptional regulator [Kiritimatiellia bacterium]
RLIGQSAAMNNVFDLINRVAQTDSTVLVTGETGTGKELVARMIHYRSRRAAKPLVALNCASLNPNLIESDLFGHEKGAFTGALTTRRGRFEEADGGTLFLDEISEISMESQAKLLRVLQEGEIQRIGGNSRMHVDVRVIASTNRDLEGQVKSGRFRQDLFYRLMVIPIRLPPLRERIDDIGRLAAHFADVYGRRYRSSSVKISEKTNEYLSGLEWKGNVRELQHAVERAVVLSNSTELQPGDFMFDKGTGQTTSQSGTLGKYLNSKTRDYLVEVLNRTQWHKQHAAEILGMDRVTLYRLLKKHHLEEGTVRDDDLPVD